MVVPDIKLPDVKKETGEKDGGVSIKEKDVKSSSPSVKLPDIDRVPEGKVFLDGVDTRYVR